MVWRNKNRERLKSAPHLRLKKRKTFFLENLKFLKFFFSQKKSHSAAKCKRGTFWIINIHSVAKYQKTRRGDPLGTSDFVGFLEKVNFGLSLPWRDLALGGFRIVSKKWTDQCEDCSLKNKQDGNVPSRRHILGSKIFKKQLLEIFGKKYFFPKKVFGKKSRTMPKNLKRGHLGSFNVFYEPKMQGGTL